MLPLGTRHFHFDVVEPEFRQIDRKLLLPLVFRFRTRLIVALERRAPRLRRFQRRLLRRFQRLLRTFRRRLRPRQHIVMDLAQLRLPHHLAKLLHHTRINIRPVTVKRPQIAHDIARLLQIPQQLAIHLVARQPLRHLCHTCQLFRQTLTFKFKTRHNVSFSKYG